MAGIEERGGSYRIPFRCHGKQYIFTLGNLSENQAKSKSDQVGGPGELYQSHAAAPQPLPAAQRRNDAGPGARQGDFRPHAQEERNRSSERKSTRLNSS